MDSFYRGRFGFAYILGLLLPWRAEITLFGRETMLSPFDLFWPLVLFSGMKARPDPGVALAMIFAALAAYHTSPSALITVYAVFAGIALRGIDFERFFAGLSHGLIGSLAIGAVLFAATETLARDGGYFSALYSSKNGLAFLVAVTGIFTGRALWFLGAFAAQSRGTLIALAIAVARKKPLVAVGLLAGFLLLFSTPTDRIEFATKILYYIGETPLLGVGPHLHYGLDLYFKTLLDFGIVGFGVLIAILSYSAVIHRGSPMLLFILVFGLAHDPIRWPLFWMLILANQPLTTSAPRAS